MSFYLLKFIPASRQHQPLLFISYFKRCFTYLRLYIYPFSNVGLPIQGATRNLAKEKLNEKIPANHSLLILVVGCWLGILVVTITLIIGS